MAGAADTAIDAFRPDLVPTVPAGGIRLALPSVLRRFAVQAFASTAVMARTRHRRCNMLRPRNDERLTRLTWGGSRRNARTGIGSMMIFRDTDSLIVRLLLAAVLIIGPVGTSPVMAADFECPHAMHSKLAAAFHDCCDPEPPAPERTCEVTCVQAQCGSTVVPVLLADAEGVHHDPCSTRRSWRLCGLASSPRQRGAAAQVTRRVVSISTRRCHWVSVHRTPTSRSQRSAAPARRSG